MVTLDSLIARVSPSRLETAASCLARILFGYVEREPWGFRASAQFGHAVDDLRGGFYQEKIRTGITSTRSDARDRFAAAWDFHADAIDDWQGWKRGELLDSGTKGAGTWRDEVAQFVEPKGVQVRLERVVHDPTTGDPFVLNGIIDLTAKIAGRDTIVDNKTSERRYQASRVVRSFQPAAYSVLGGFGAFEYHVQTVTASPELQVLRAEISDNDRHSFLLRAGMLRRQIAHAWTTGDWLPNRSHFLCTRRYCDHWARCEKRFGGRVPE